VSDEAEPEIGRKEHVAVPRLPAPRRLNALAHGTRGLFELPADARANLTADPKIRAVVLTASGRPFCAGDHMAGVARAGGLPADEQPHTCPSSAARHLKSGPRSPASVGRRSSEPLLAIADAGSADLLDARTSEIQRSQRSHITEGVLGLPRETKR
jgi:hypothetical protein